MADESAKVDAYIENSPEFARPILQRLRKAVHRGCPKVEEVIKWGCPYFSHHGLMCGMAAFKGHVGFGFWRAKELDDPAGLFLTGTGAKASMCSAKFLSLKEVPTQKVLVDYIRRAKALNELAAEEKKQSKQAASKSKKKSSPTKKATGSRSKRKPVVVPKVPAELAVELKRNSAARKFYDSLAPGQKRDYLEWIIAAKRATTKTKRIETMISQLAEGKRLNWKYE